MDMEIEESLKRYMRDNFMGDVDNVDKDDWIGDAFAKETMFKKWYWMGILGIVDFMVMNERIGWNMSAINGHDEHLQLTSWKIRIILAEQLLAFWDEFGCDHIAGARMQLAMVLSGHHPLSIPEGFQPLCCVCKLEDGFQATVHENQCNEVSTQSCGWKGFYSMRHIVACSHSECSLHAHSFCIDSGIFIFSLSQFKDLSCFDCLPQKYSWIVDFKPWIWIQMPKEKMQWQNWPCRRQKLGHKANSSTNPPAY